jgi:hypothetical protein
MKFIALTSLALLVSTSAFAASGTAIAAGSVSTTYVITKPGAYYLAGDRVMTDNTKSAISIQCDDVTLDLNGYSLSFSNSSSGVGCAVTLGINANIEVRNGSVFSVPSVGISFGYGTQCRILNVRVSTTNAAGIATGVASLVKDCETFSTDDGVLVGIGSVVENCRVIKSAKTGISASNDSIIRGNVVENVGQQGIVVSASCLVEHNTVSGANLSSSNFGAGIWIGSAGTTVCNNNISRCGLVSIRTWGKVVVENNTIYSSDAAHVGLANMASATSLYRNNSISAKTVTSGLWVNGGGNVSY